MSETLYRTFAPDIEIRSGGDGRTLAGIAVPFNQPVRIDERLVEQFAHGAFRHQESAAHRVKLAREHIRLGGTLIGRLTLMRNDAKGQYIEARVAETPMGDETLALVRDGALSEWSIGFRERQNRRLSGGVIERVTADLREVALTLEGAYGEAAAVAAVRSADDRPNLEQARQILAGLPTLPPL